jgi:hypothetical protein
VNLEFYLMAGCYLAGILTMGWVKSFQIKMLQADLDQALVNENLARRDLERTTGAANVVVDSERRINRAQSLPGTDGLRVLLSDARVEPPAGSSGKT